MSQIESSHRVAAFNLCGSNRRMFVTSSKATTEPASGSGKPPEPRFRHVDAVHRDYASRLLFSRLEVQGIPTLLMKMSHRPMLRKTEGFGQVHF